MLLIIWFSGGSAFADIAIQSPELDYSLHAKYIYHFTKYIEWPETQQSGPFIVGIYSNHDLYLELKKIADSKKVKGRSMLPIELSPEDDPANCSMVFIGRAAIKTMDRVVLKIGGRPVIVMGDKAGLTYKGVEINFLVRDDMLRFEIEPTALDNKKIKIANELKRLALPGKN